ncbi:MAG: hypothetical protein BWX70_02457 [Verrucomicrobia bacterium ADurb.Bin070]|nr:MAG: hypothetical protein BWX70_02457 [Verrucomicrobia bacterium ADurb.Bin070]
MSMPLMISLRAARSLGLPIMTMALVRLSASILMLSLLSCPSLLLPSAAAEEEEDEERLARAATASASVVLRDGVSAAPLGAPAGAASSFLDVALPIRSFSMVETSSASANSKRCTSTLTSGEVSISSTLMMRSKKFMFSLRVMMMS